MEYAWQKNLSFLVSHTNRASQYLSPSQLALTVVIIHENWKLKRRRALSQLAYAILSFLFRIAWKANGKLRNLVTILKA